MLMADCSLHKQEGLPCAVDNILKPLIPKLSTIVSSTDQFIKLKIPKSVNSDMVILCADVASLYPSIPTQFGLRRINELLTFHFLWPRDKIDLTLELLNWILTNNSVEFNGIYSLIRLRKVVFALPYL